MATPRVLTIPSQDTHNWSINNKGELLGDLAFTRNIDLESNQGKVRLAERVAILFDNTTDASPKWGATEYPRGFVQSDADGTDRWWAMIGDKSYIGGGSPFWNSSGIDPSTGWAQDVIVLPPAAAVDSMEVFIKNIVPEQSFSAPILSSTDTTPITITLNGVFSISSGDQVTVSGHTVNINANGVWTVEKTGASTYTLEGSIATGAGAGGATGTMTKITSRSSYGKDMLISPDGNGDLSMLNGSASTTGNIQSFAISSSTNTSPIKVTLVTATGYTDSGIYTGNKVTITGHTVNTNANGTWTVTRLAPWIFLLNSSTGNGIGGGDGTFATSAWRLAWWTGNLNQPALSTTYPTVLKRFGNIFLVGNGNYVHTIDTSLNVAYQRLIFPTGYFVNCIAVAPDFVWFFLSNTERQDAIAARWDGGEELYETPIRAYDYTIHTAIIKDGIPYLLNGKGQLLKLNGQAFEELDVLPCFVSKQRWGDGSTILLDKVCHRNSMTIIDGLIHVVLKATMNNDSNDKTTLENFSSGIWCYDEKNGFYCKYAVGNYRSTDGDWGDKVLYAAGALCQTTLEKGRFLLGAVVYTDTPAGSGDSAIFVSKTTSTTLQRGQIVSSQIHIPSLTSMYVHVPVTRAIWKYLSYTFERFMEVSDYVIVKMRTSKSITRTYQSITPITWVNGTTFTAAVSGSPCLSSAKAGDEIEFITGPGAGGTFHITTITILLGTATVVLDETVPSASVGLQSAAYLNNWTKVSSINGTNTGIQEKVVSLIRNSSWIQIKVELRGSSISPEIQDLTLGYEPLGR